MSEAPEEKEPEQQEEESEEGYAVGVLLEDPSGGGGLLIEPADLAEQGPAPRDPVVRDARRTVRESEDHNTVDSRERVLLIDAHAHLGGKSLSGQTELRALTRGVGRGSLPSFLYYNASPDKTLVRKMVDSLTHFCRDEEYYSGCQHPIVASLGLVLDMGFVAMKPIITTHLSRMGLAIKKRELDWDATPPAYYACPQDTESAAQQMIWYPRDDAAWNEALDKVAESSKYRPGQVWPFVGFDPRRPSGVDIVKARLESGAFVGVKLYSRTGWVPIHNRCLYGDDVGDPLDDRCDELYTYLVANDVPVLVHCSPTGFPPDDFLVLPWSCTKLRKKTTGAVPTPVFVQTTGVASPTGYGTIPDVLWPPTYDGASPYKKLSTTDEILAIREAASYLGNCCVYMQMTTSPYTWECVLEKHPTLRLCLAHFGAEVGVYSTPERNVPYDEKWQEVLELHPYVAGAAYPYPADRQRARDFATLFKNGVVRLVRSKCGKTAARAERRIWQEHFFENDPDWSTWFTEWNTAYPLTWHAKILEMIADSNYPNLYTDIAYLTTRRELFNGVFRPTVDQALAGADDHGKALRSKLMIGTDWFMIEMQSFSPRDFWKMVLKGFMPDFAETVKPHIKRLLLWELWSRQNALRWLNLLPRYGGAGLDMMQDSCFEGVDADSLPAWWKNLRKHYEENLHLIKDEPMARFEG